MEAEGKVQAAVTPSDAVTTASRPTKPRERAFWNALACAGVVHLSLVAGFVLSPPQHRRDPWGEKSGQTDGVSVAMVDAADLSSSNTFAEHAKLPELRVPTPPIQSPPPVPKEEVRPPEEVKEEPVLPPKDAQAPELVTPDEAAKQNKAAKEQTKDIKEQKREPDNPAWPIETQKLAPELAPTMKPQEADAPSPPKKAKTAQPQAPKASPPLQLSLPDMAIAPSGGSAAFSRPAGITRSGENDEFGRAVIRALRKSMPQIAARGRVTVRFLLSDNGNLVEVQIVRSSGDPVLDQSVLFAVKQSSFPFPARNAPLVDRTFIVTYIYETLGRG